MIHKNLIQGINMINHTLDINGLICLACQNLKNCRTSGKILPFMGRKCPHPLIYLKHDVLEKNKPELELAPRC